MVDVICPGCRLGLPAGTQGATLPATNASAECLALCGEVVANGMLHHDVLGVWHQTCVDAYALQHVSPVTKPIRICFALNGLYLVLSKGWTGIQARDAHRHLANTVPRDQWPRFEPPEAVGDVTVMEPAMAGTPAEQAEAVELWGRSVWDAWAHVHADVAEMTTRQLGDWRPRPPGSGASG